MYSQTLDALEKFDNQHDFERMCNDLLIAQGNQDIVPVAPRGGPDGGRDITFTTYNGTKGLACATIGKDDINRKFKNDFSQRKRGEYQKYFFFCTTYLTSSQKKGFIAYGLNELDAELIPCDIEALRCLLDAYPKIKEKWLHISNDKVIKRDRLFNAYKILLVAADKYLFEMQQLNHLPSYANVSSSSVDETVIEIDLEDAGTEVLPIFFKLRGAFHEFAIQLSIGGTSPEEISMRRKKVFEEAEALKTAIRSRLKELES